MIIRNLIIQEEQIDKNVYIYLKSFFNQLTIEKFNGYKGKLFDLMRNGELEGFCWQTTETIALFMPDNTIIYRGNLHIKNIGAYRHSFIEFHYNGKEYIFDPSLNSIDTKEHYFKILRVEIEGHTTSKQIKDFFMCYVNNPLKRYNYISEEVKYLEDRYLKQVYGKNINNIILIHDEENVNAPMYRNGVVYKDIEIEKNMIKSLTAHYI